jgi:chemotaxis response regulator CheB
MADILSRRSTLPVKQADENDKLRPGTVYNRAAEQCICS